MARQSLANFLREHLNSIDELKGPCSVVTLVHYQGPGIQEVKSFRLGAQPIDPSDLDKSIKVTADNHAGGLVGVQTYEVRVFYEKTDDMPQGSWTFRVAGEQELGGMGTEAPTTTGQLMQGMRHQDALMKGFLEMARTCILGQGQLLQAYQNREEKLMQENHDAIELAKTVYLQQAESMHKLEMDRLQFERSTVERKKIMTVLPALANTIFNREVFPQAAEDTALIEGLVDSLNEEQITKFMAVLTPEQAMLIGARFLKAQEKINAERAETARLQKKNPGNGSDISTNGTKGS